jgi:hypothetical protein
MNLRKARAELNKLKQSMNGRTGGHQAAVARLEAGLGSVASA